MQAENKKLNYIFSDCIPLIKDIPYSNKIRWSIDIDPITTEKAFENIIKKLIKESLQEIDKENNFSSEDIEVNSCKDKKFTTSLQILQ